MNVEYLGGVFPRLLGFCVWLTGLPSAGKTTLALALERALTPYVGHRAVVLDGDILRRGLCKDLGFSLADRNENVRRVAEAAKLLMAVGGVPIVALISPYAAARMKARELLQGSEATTRFVEVFVDCPPWVCEERDSKGLWKKARAGELERFTGVDDPYEIPLRAEVTVRTDKMSVEDCTMVVERVLKELGRI